jgi:hypothetical protein
MPAVTSYCGVAWVIAAAGCCLPVDPDKTSAPGVGPTLVVDPADACDAYLRDEKAADAKYKGRSVEVSGVVATEVAVMADGHPACVLASRLAGHRVAISFQRSQVDAASGLREGQMVKVRGRFYRGEVIDRRKPDVCVYVHDAVLVE